MDLLKVFKGNIQDHIFSLDGDRFVYLKSMATGLRVRSITTGEIRTLPFTHLFDIHSEDVYRDCDGANNSSQGHWRLVKRDCSDFKAGDLIWVTMKHLLANHLRRTRQNILAFTYPISIENETNFVKNKPHDTYEVDSNYNLKLLSLETKFKCDKLYICLFFNDKEVFVKVGITGSKNVLTRFSGPSKNGGYDIIPLFTGQANPQYIHQYEYELKSLLKGLSYTPENIFAGSNECFNNISKEALDVLSQYTFTNILLDDLDSLPSILLFNKKVKSRKGLAA